MHRLGDLGRLRRPRPRPLASVVALACAAVATVGVALPGAIAPTPASAGTSPTPVIIDTDLYSNVDDVLAIATAFALQAQGVDKVVALGVDTRTNRPSVQPSSWKCAAAIAQWYGDANVPLGTDMPDAGTTPHSPDFAGACAAKATRAIGTPRNAVDVYRQALAAQPDHSVVMVAIGYEENLSALLASAPDAYSPLSGSALIALKVKVLEVTGGGYPSNSGENNFVGDAGAAQAVAAGWPTKVVYDGYEVGAQVFTGGSVSSVDPSGSPMRAALEAFDGPNSSVASFDAVTMYHALVPSDGALTEVGPGTNTIGTFGDNNFVLGPGNQYYLTLTDAPKLQATLEGLLDVLPSGVAQSITFTSTPPGAPVVGGTYHVTATGGASGRPVTFSIDASSTSGCTVNASTDVVTFGGPAGSCVIDANQQGTSSFLAAPEAQQPLAVGKAAQSITFTSTPPGAAVVGATYTVAASGGPSGLPVTFSIDASSTSGCRLNAATDVVTFVGPAGSCVIDARQAGNASYLSAPEAQQAVSVGKVVQSITFTSTPPKAPPVGSAYAVTAIGGPSGLPVTFSIDASSTSGCTLNASTDVVTFAGPAGSCVIDAGQAGNSSFLAAPTVQQAIAVARAAQSVRFVAPQPVRSRVTGRYVPRALATSGLPVSFAIARATRQICVRTTAYVRFLRPGTCAIIASQPGNATYLAARPVILRVTVTR